MNFPTLILPVDKDLFRLVWFRKIFYAKLQREITHISMIIFCAFCSSSRYLLAIKNTIRSKIAEKTQPDCQIKRTCLERNLKFLQNYAYSEFPFLFQGKRRLQSNFKRCFRRRYEAINCMAKFYQVSSSLLNSL